MLLLLLPKPKFNLKLRNPGSPGMQAETQIHTHTQRESGRGTGNFGLSRKAETAGSALATTPEILIIKAENLHISEHFSTSVREMGRIMRTARHKRTQGQWETGTVGQWYSGPAELPPSGRWSIEADLLPFRAKEDN